MADAGSRFVRRFAGHGRIVRSARERWAGCRDRLAASAHSCVYRRAAGRREPRVALDHHYSTVRDGVRFGARGSRRERRRSHNPRPAAWRAAHRALVVRNVRARAPAPCRADPPQTAPYRRSIVIDRVQAMRIFVRIVDASSFTRAAEPLEIPRAAATTTVQALESLPVLRLLARTTTQV